MENRREKGAVSIEAALILAIFLLGYTAIISAASFIRAQMIIQYSISQAAKEMSSYCYLVSKTGIMDDSHRLNGEAGSFKEDTDKVIDTVVKLYDAIDSGSSEISGQVQEIAECTELNDFVSSATDLTNVTQDEFNKMNSAATTMMETGQAYFSNPKQILKGIASLAKDGDRTFGKAGRHDHGKHLRGQADGNGDAEQECFQPVAFRNAIDEEHQRNHDQHEAD